MIVDELRWFHGYYVGGSRGIFVQPVRNKD